MHHQQTVKNPPLKGVQGILVVAGLLAALILDSVLVQLLAPVIGGSNAGLLFWVVGAGVAMWTMRRYVLAYSYATNSNTLQITFAYGRYRRLLEEIYFNNMYHSGTLEEMKKRYPGARVNRAVRRGSEHAELALAYRSNGKTCIIVLQPDDAIRAIITENTKKKK